MASRDEYQEFEGRQPTFETSLLQFPDHDPSRTIHKANVHVRTHIEKQPQKATSYPLWTPFWLRRSILLAFALFFTLCWVGLILIWDQARRQDGLALTLSHNHYAWTYGPTAILVVIVSLWRQVDYACKSLQPWHELRSPTSASRSLLLDYISPLQIVSFVASIRHRHWAVNITITVFAILKLTTLFSTVLLISLSTTKSASVPINLAASFNGTNIWPGIVPAQSYNFAKNTTLQYPLDETRTYLNLSTTPVYSYLSLIQGGPATSSDGQDSFAFPTFDYSASMANTYSITARLNIFEPLLSCETADVSISHSPNTTARHELKFNSPTCHIGYDDDTSIFGTDLPSGSCPSQSFGYYFIRHNCSMPTPITLFDYRNVSVPTDASVGGDYRFIVFVANFHNAEVFDGSSSVTCSSTVHNISAVICKLDYNMVYGNVTKSVTNDDYHVEKASETSSSRLQDLQSLQLTELVHSTLFSARSIFGLITAFPDGITLADAKDSFFGLMSKLRGSTNVSLASLEQFIDPEILLNTSSRVLSSLAVQVAQLHVLNGSKSSVIATDFYVEDRLHIKNISLWVMVTDFVVLTGLTLLLLFVSPKSCIQRDPEPLITSAAILAESPDVNRLLRRIGQYRRRFTEKQLQSVSFHIQHHPTFSLVTNLPDNYIPRKAVWQGFWVPIPLRYWMIALTIMFPLVLIITLEVIFQISQTNEGLATVFDDFNSPSSALRYSSTLIMLLVATLFNALDFQISVFAPFQKLASGSTSGNLLSRILGRIPVIALYEAVQHRYFGAFFSNLAGLIGSILTIIVSGLWVVNGVPYVHTVTGDAISTWNWTWSQSVMDDGGAAVKLDSLDRGGIANATGVWGDLALPLMTNVTSTSPDFNGNFSITLPAIRPVLDCSIIPQEDILIYNTTVASGHPGTDVLTGVVSAYVKLPFGCQGGQGGNQTFTYFNQSLRTAGSYDLFPIAILQDLHLGPWPIVKGTDPVWLSYGEQSNNLQQPDNPAGCPSIGLIMGYLNTAFTPAKNITAAVCHQRIQQVQTRVTYNGLPEHNIIDTTNPPLPDESTAVYLTNGSTGVTSFPFRIESHLNNELTLYDAERPVYDGNQLTIDPFFDHIMRGPVNVSFEEMFSNRSKLLEAADRMYRKYMVQVAAAKFRSTTSTEPGVALTGNSTTMVCRLQVNKASKIILQAMLAAMFLLGVLAILTSKIRNVLPHNPCSILGTMALFAGSDLCENRILPNNAAYLTDKEIRHHLDGYLFSLGWWKNKGTSGMSKRFGIDVGQATIAVEDKKPQNTTECASLPKDW